MNIEESEHLADVLDRATVNTTAYTNACIDKAQQAAKPEQVQVDGVWPITECVDCSDEIPAGRLALGRVRCVHCQGVKERKQANYTS